MSGEKTEDPTDKRLQDLRKKGDVAKSKDVPATLSTLAILLYLLYSGPKFLDGFTELFGRSIEAATNPEWVDVSVLLAHSLTVLAWLVAPALVIGIIFTLVGNWGQFGFLLAFKALEPKLDKFNPATNLKTMFSPDALFEFMMSFIKLAALTYIAYLVLTRAIGALISCLYAGWGAVPGVLAIMFKETLIYFAAAFIILAGADYAFRRFNFLKKNKMSKDEVKREYKESEGDPQIKGRRKQLHEEMMEQAIVERTRTADVLIVNPTHYAVALKYEEGADKLPVAVGKGEGRLALKMIKAAEEAGVPIMRDILLARGLYADCALDHQIPVEYIKPVAETLKWARKLKRG